jgi:hypothetical protein
MLDSGFQNVGIGEPQPPGPWVDDQICICGDHLEKYDRFNSGVTFAEAAAQLRFENKQAEISQNPNMGWTMEAGSKDEAPGGYRGRGAILTMMRRMKLERWYDKHSTCPEGDHDWEEFCQNYPDSPNCRDFDEWLARGKPEPVFYEEDDDDDDEEYDDFEIPF